MPGGSIVLARLEVDFLGSCSTAWRATAVSSWVSRIGTKSVTGEELLQDGEMAIRATSYGDVRLRHGHQPAADRRGTRALGRLPRALSPSRGSVWW